MLPNYLAKIKSAGIYRFVWDKSEIPGVEADILRLVVGYSEKGPFNTPVYVTTESEFKQIFGGVSKKMERYGMWFHRLAIQALKGGPILALNLKNFENPFKEGTDQYKAFDEKGYNQVEYAAFDPHESIFLTDEAGAILENLRLKVKDLYNTDRFWKLEPDHMEELYDMSDEFGGTIKYRSDKPANGRETKSRYITITHTDSRESSMSVFLRGFEPKGYDVPIKEWYSAVLNGEDVPSYLEGHENDLVSQYFAEIFIFKGKFTPEVAASDKLSKFFTVNGQDVRLKPYIINAFGEKIDTLEALANNDASNFVKSYSGILLPEFRSANNTVISLDAQVNGDNYVHKLMMRLNQSLLYDGDIDAGELDTTGWSLGPKYTKGMMSLMRVDPVVYTAVFTNTGTEAKPEMNWKYTADKEDHDRLTADFYKYDGLEYEVTDEYEMTFDDTDSRFGKAGIREGDSIYLQPTAEDNPATEEDESAGMLAHIVKIKEENVETTIDEWQVSGSDEIFTEEPVIDHVEAQEAVPEHWTVNGEGSYDAEPVVNHVEAQEAKPAVIRGTISHDSDINTPGTAVHATYRKVGDYGMIVSGELEEDAIHTIDGQPTNRFGVAIQIPAEYEEGATWRIGTKELGAVKEEMDSNPSDWTRALYLYPAVIGNGLSLAGVTGETLEVTISYADGKTEMFEVTYTGMEDDESINDLGGEPIEPAQEAVPEHWTVNGEGSYETEPVVEYVEAQEAVPEHWTVNGEGSYETEPTVTQTKVTYVRYTVSLDNPVPSAATIYKCMGSVTATSAGLKPCYFQGFTFGNPKPESTKQIDKLEWQNYMLEALTNYRGIRLALTNRVDSDWRYLVDTFEGFVDNECKATLSNLCMSKDNGFGLLNFPKMSNFSKCQYTSFRNEKNEFLTKYIPLGGNSLKPMARMFSLPSQENGASWCAFFTALAIRDGNTGIREEVPSAALVSNVFIKKYSTFLPYTIMAGPNRGVVRETGLIGPDFNFSREDLDNLEPFGVNCMVYEPRKGTFINSNQTAKQNPVTTLSKINVRELCIFLQDEIEKLLQDYQWDFNTPNLQQRVKDRADVILETCKNNGGVYLYSNQCDGHNNTDDVINNEMFILSTAIEPGMGAGKMVQELTIYRKGGMSSKIVEY